MTSQALGFWRGDRQRRVDRLLRLRAAVHGRDVDARLARQELGRTALVASVTEFQGFCRDLHDEASDAFAQFAGVDTTATRHIRAALRLSRALDRGNATDNALKDDFARFGMSLRAATDRADPGSPARWTLLQTLTGDRNALVHANPSVSGRAADNPSVATIRSNFVELGRLARTLDEVVAMHLASLFGKPKPW